MARDEDQNEASRQGHWRLASTARAASQTTAVGLAVLTALTWLVCAYFGEGFLSSFNLFTLSQITSQAIVLGFAQLVVLSVGRMNLAVGAIGVCVVMLTAWLTGVHHVQPVIGIALGLAVGGLAGVLMSWIELKTKLHSFIVTLAMGSIYTGIMLLLTRSEPIGTVPETLTEFGRSYLFSPSLSYLIIPAVLVVGGMLYLYLRSTLGWRMLAVGANETAARYSGIRVPLVVGAAFALSGGLCALAGMMEMSRVSAGLPSLGADWLLVSFIVPVLGGTALRGGSVAIMGAVFAALFLKSLSSGFVSLDVPIYWQSFAEAMVLLLAVVADEARRRRRSSAESAVVIETEVARVESTQKRRESHA